jgi:hypothetical protein
MINGSGWELTNGRPEPTRIVLDRSATLQGGVNYPAAGNLARFRRGTTDLTYLNRDHRKDYVQLLDGGIADNLGLTTPFTFLTSQTELPSILSWVNIGKIDKLLFVVVNARGESRNDFGTRARPPGALDSLLTSIGTDRCHQLSAPRPCRRHHRRSGQTKIHGGRRIRFHRGPELPDALPRHRNRVDAFAG